MHKANCRPQSSHQGAHTQRCPWRNNPATTQVAPQVLCLWHGFPFEGTEHRPLERPPSGNGHEGEPCVENEVVKCLPGHRIILRLAFFIFYFYIDCLFPETYFFALEPPGWRWSTGRRTALSTHPFRKSSRGLSDLLWWGSLGVRWRLWCGHRSSCSITGPAHARPLPVRPYVECREVAIEMSDLGQKGNAPQETRHQNATPTAASVFIGQSLPPPPSIPPPPWAEDELSTK